MEVDLLERRAHAYVAEVDCRAASCAPLVSALRHATLLALDGERTAAERWLESAEAGASTEWLLARMLVEDRAGRDATAASFSRRLLETQNADGGRGWLPDQVSDAMTTGRAVYALVSTEPSPAKEYIYTYWGTAWATIGLANVLAPLPDPRE